MEARPLPTQREEPGGETVRPPMGSSAEERSSRGPERERLPAEADASRDDDDESRRGEKITNGAKREDNGDDLPKQPSQSSPPIPTPIARVSTSTSPARDGINDDDDDEEASDTEEEEDDDEETKERVQDILAQMLSPADHIHKESSMIMSQQNKTTATTALVADEATATIFSPPHQRPPESLKRFAVSLNLDEPHEGGEDDDDDEAQEPASQEDDPLHLILNRLLPHTTASPQQTIHETESTFTPLSIAKSRVKDGKNPRNDEDDYDDDAIRAITRLLKPSEKRDTGENFLQEEVNVILIPEIRSFSSSPSSAAPLSSTWQNSDDTDHLLDLAENEKAEAREKHSVLPKAAELLQKLDLAPVPVDVPPQQQGSPLQETAATTRQEEQQEEEEDEVSKTVRTLEAQLRTLQDQLRRETRLEEDDDGDDPSTVRSRLRREIASSSSSSNEATNHEIAKLIKLHVLCVFLPMVATRRLTKEEEGDDEIAEEDELALPQAYLEYVSSHPRYLARLAAGSPQEDEFFPTLAALVKAAKEGRERRRERRMTSRRALGRTIERLIPTTVVVDEEAACRDPCRRVAAALEDGFKVRVVERPLHNPHLSFIFDELTACQVIILPSGDDPLETMRWARETAEWLATGCFEFESVLLVVQLNMAACKGARATAVRAALRNVCSAMSFLTSPAPRVVMRVAYTPLHAASVLRHFLDEVIPKSEEEEWYRQRDRFKQSMPPHGLHAMQIKFLVSSFPRQLNALVAEEMVVHRHITPGQVIQLAPGATRLLSETQRYAISAVARVDTFPVVGSAIERFGEDEEDQPGERNEEAQMESTPQASASSSGAVSDQRGAKILTHARKRRKLGLGDAGSDGQTTLKWMS